MIEKLNILHRYSDHIALISLGHSYSVPSRITKKHLVDLLAGFGDDELIDIAQIETQDGVPRPVIARVAGVKTDGPEWLCLCEDKQQ